MKEAECRWGGVQKEEKRKERGGGEIWGEVKERSGQCSLL